MKLTLASIILILIIIIIIIIITSTATVISNVEYLSFEKKEEEK